MKTFNSIESLIKAKASESLKSYAYDQPESIDWSINGLRNEILKERNYVSKKVRRCYDKFSASLNGVEVGQYFIENFGVVK